MGVWGRSRVDYDRCIYANGVLLLHGPSSEPKFQNCPRKGHEWAGAKVIGSCRRPHKDNHSHLRRTISTLQSTEEACFGKETRVPKENVSKGKENMWTSCRVVSIEIWICISWLWSRWDNHFLPWCVLHVEVNWLNYAKFTELCKNLLHLLLFF